MRPSEILPDGVSRETRADQSDWTDWTDRSRAIDDAMTQHDGRMTQPNDRRRANGKATKECAGMRWPAKTVVALAFDCRTATGVAQWRMWRSKTLGAARLDDRRVMTELRSDAAK